MKRLLLTVVATLLLVALVVPAFVSADAPPENSVSVDVSGDGVWEDDHLSVSLYPGQSKSFLIDVHNNLDIDLHIMVIAEPGCVCGNNVTACVTPDENTLPASGTVSFVLNVTARAIAPPGAFLVALSVETDTEVPPSGNGNGGDEEPDPGEPHHMVLSSLYDTRVAGTNHELTATVYDASSNPVPGASVAWAVLSGNGTVVELATDIITNAAGRAVAQVSSSVVGTTVVRCSAGSGIENSITLVWMADTVDNGDAPPPVKKGLPAWAVFIIFIAIIGGGYGVYFYLKKRKPKKDALTDLFEGKDENIDDVLGTD